MMDDSSFNQLKAALRLTPDNGALLALVIRGHLDRGELAAAMELVSAYGGDYSGSDELALVAGRVYLDNGNPEAALACLDGDTAEIMLLKARVLLALGRRTEGYEAYQSAIRENSTLEDPELAASLQVKVVDFASNRTGTRLKVISNDNTNVTELDRLVEPRQEPIGFADIGGLDSVKKTIHKKIILPYQKPGLFKRFRKRVGGGILMYGPPGCGKTLLARATAGECKAEFFNVSISDVLDMYIGESERKLHELFQRARESSPAVLFFDEVEALGGKRQNTRDSTTSKLVSQFLSEMDGFAQNNHGVLILAATNVPWAVDAAFRRPGRFDRVLFVPPPDVVARKSILDHLLRNRPAEPNIDTDYLAGKTSGFSGADLSELVETAVDEAIEESIAHEEERLINNGHFKAALREIRPTTLEWLKSARNYARYANEGGQYNDVLDFLKRYAKD